MQIIEKVMYSLNPGVSDELFLKAVEKSDRFLINQPGFLSRHISKLPQSSEWMALVFWKDMESALSAANEFNHSEFASDFNATLYKDSVVMKHFLVQHSVSAS